MPIAGQHVLHWFLELDGGRSGNGFGADPISYSEIAAWRDLTSARPEVWEVRAIKAMDVAFLNELAKRKD